MNKEQILKIIEEDKWKNKDERYLKEIQKLLDLTDNVKNEKLKRQIIEQEIKFDRTLTKITREMLTKILNEGE